MIPTKTTAASSQSKFVLGTLAVIVVVLIALYFVVLNFALSNNGVFDFTVPSRSGGDTFNLDSGEFSTMHAIATGVAIYLTGISLWFVRQKQSKIAVLMTNGLVVYVSIYSALILGNVLDEEFGTVASVIGVIASLGVASIFSSYSILKAVPKKNNS